MAAGKLARVHGVFPTAKLLRLEYGKLKRIAEGGAPAVRAVSPPATFLELVPSQAVGLSECVIELEGPRGRMRIHYRRRRRLHPTFRLITRAEAVGMWIAVSY